MYWAPMCGTRGGLGLGDGFAKIFPRGIYLELTRDVWPRGLGNKTKEMNCSLLSLGIISFALFPQALEPSVNFNTSKVV